MFEPRLQALYVPPGWDAREEISLLERSGKANLLATSVSLDNPLTTEEYASLQSDDMPSEFPGYRENAFYTARLLGDRSCWVRDFEWDPPDFRSSVRQLQVYYSDGKRGHTVTVTAPLAYFLSEEPVLLRDLRGVRLAPSTTQEIAPNR